VIAFLHDNLEHTLAALLLVSRIGDVLSTWLVTPGLTLEANPLVRKLRWRFALLTLLIAGVPYLSLPAGLMMLPPFLMVSASNITGAWLVRRVGEQRYFELMLEAARQSRLRQAIWPLLASAAFLLLLAASVWLFYPDPARDWGFWIGMGIALYAGVRVLHGSLYYRRIFRRAAETPAQGPATPPAA